MIIGLIVLVWLGMGVAGSLIGSSKGYSPAEGFLWGIALGAAGVVIITLRKPKGELPEAKAPIPYRDFRDIQRERDSKKAS